MAEIGTTMKALKGAEVAVSITSVCYLAQFYPALFDPLDYSPPGSSVHGILQARLLEWIAMPSSKGSSRPRN